MAPDDHGDGDEPGTRYDVTAGAVIGTGHVDIRLDDDPRPKAASRRPLAGTTWVPWCAAKEPLIARRPTGSCPSRSDPRR